MIMVNMTIFRCVTRPMWNPSERSALPATHTSEHAAIISDHVMMMNMTVMLMMMRTMMKLIMTMMMMTMIMMPPTLWHIQRNSPQLWWWYDRFSPAKAPLNITTIIGNICICLCICFCICICVYICICICICICVCRHSHTLFQYTSTVIVARKGQRSNSKHNSYIFLAFS